MAGSKIAATVATDQAAFLQVTPEQREEYNSFGPWLQEIRQESDMPPCFRDAYAEHSQARFLVKVPVSVERRNAYPGMELYQAVLAVDADNVFLLQRESGQTSTQSIATQEIRAIQVCQNLLKGELSFLRADGTRFEFMYNAVSQPLIEAIVDFLRAQFPEQPGLREDWRPAAVEDFGFRSILSAQVRRQASVVPLHSETPGRRTRDAQGRRRTYLGLLALGTDRDLVLVDQGKTLRRRKEAVYVCRTTYIPWAALSGATEVDPESPRPVEYRSLLLSLGTGTLRFDLFEPAPLLTHLTRALAG